MSVMHLSRVVSPDEPLTPSMAAVRISSLDAEPFGVRGVPGVLAMEFFLSEMVSA